MEAFAFLKRGRCSLQPETEDVVHGVAQLGEVCVFLDIGIRVQVVSFSHLAGDVGVGEHNHRYPPQQHMTLEILQNFKAALSRHVEVEQQQVRGIEAEGRKLREILLHGRNGLVAVMDDLEIVLNPGPFHGDFDEAGGGIIVLGKDNASRSSAPVICIHPKSEPRERAGDRDPTP